MPPASRPPSPTGATRSGATPPSRWPRSSQRRALRRSSRSSWSASWGPRTTASSRSRSASPRWCSCPRTSGSRSRQRASWPSTAERGRSRGAGRRAEAEAVPRAALPILFALAGPIANAYDARDGLAAARDGARRVRAERRRLHRRVRGARPVVGWTLRLALAESAVEAGASIALVLFGAGVTGAAVGRAIGYVFGVAVRFVLIARGRRPRARSRGGPARPRSPDRALRGRAADHRRRVRHDHQIDILMIGAILGTTAVGLFPAPQS